MGSRILRSAPGGMHSLNVYEVRPRKDHRGVNLISDALPFGRLCDGVAQQMTSSG
jgi:hypothetical protein